MEETKLVGVHQTASHYPVEAQKYLHVAACASSFLPGCGCDGVVRERRENPVLSEECEDQKRTKIAEPGLHELE